MRFQGDPLSDFPPLNFRTYLYSGNREFVDAVSRASEHPETFDLPDVTTLRAGDVVKISNGRERFWVVLTSAYPGDEKLSGRVDNYLVYKADYGFGDVINFERRNVYDVCRQAV